MKTIKTMVTISLLNFASVFALIFVSPALMQDKTSDSNNATVSKQPLPLNEPEEQPTNPSPESIASPETPPSTPTNTPAPVSETPAAPQPPAQEAPPAPPPTPTIPPAPPPPANQCIITISGTRYDVTDLRKTHSGGDIFTCGTDMTTTFFGQHNQSLLTTVMVQYRLP